MDMRITWIGQGGFLIDLLPDNLQIAIDPYLSDSVFREFGQKRLLPIPISPSKLKTDLIVCTHDHMDHLDEETLNGILWDQTRYAGPGSCIAHFFAMGIPAKKQVVLNRGDLVSLGTTKIHAVYASHTEDSIGVVVQNRNRTVYFVGDSEYDASLKMAGLFHPDVLVVCINGKYGNMSCKNAAVLAAELGVGTAIPCHYGMFAENTEDPENFRRELQKTDPWIVYKELKFNVSEGL
jgi:L-ascorbate 6-phosphate lactonase